MRRPRAAGRSDTALAHTPGADWLVYVGGGRDGVQVRLLSASAVRGAVAGALERPHRGGGRLCDVISVSECYQRV